MATAQMNTVIRHLRQTVLLKDGAGRTDGELLGAFIDEKDDAAFEALVRRHGPMVLSVCRRVVRNHHDAEDAFQATFLVLARKASSVRPRGMVANWLHGVAYRTALKAGTTAMKRHVREKQVTEMPEPEAVQQGNWMDLQPILDEELDRLPETYRLPILLCDLEGKSIKEATQQLGWPQGTLAGRLARARKMLAKRLTQRGVVLSGGALAVVLSEKAASGCVPMSLAVSTTKAAILVATGKAATSLVSAKVATLMEGVLKSMMLTKLKTVMVLLFLVGMVACGGSMVARYATAAQQVDVDQGNRQAVLKAQKSPKSLDEQLLHGEWVCKDDENGSVSLVFGPDNAVRRINENGHDAKGTYIVDWSKKPHYLDLKWIPTLPASQTIMEFIEPNKFRVETRGHEVRPKAFTDENMVFTRKEKHAAGSKQAKKEAARDIEMAEFYRRTSNFGSAFFYFQLVRYRYPDTDFAEKAKQGLEDLKKHRIRLGDGSEVWEAPEQPGKPQPPPTMIQDAPITGLEIDAFRQKLRILERRMEAIEDKGKPQPPAKAGRVASASSPAIDEVREQVKNLEKRLAALEADGKQKEAAGKELPRIGTIIVVGSTMDSAIRKAMQLLPGQTLDEKALRTSELNLAAFNATIEIIDTNDPGFKDILVRVKK